jgi:hypothetical protein
MSDRSVIATSVILITLIGTTNLLFSQQNNSLLFQRPPSRPASAEIRPIDENNVAVLMKNANSAELTAADIAEGKNNFVILPVDGLARVYSLSARLEHAKNLLISWSRASNSRILYGYDLDDLSDANISSIISDDPSNPTLVYAARNLSGDKYYLSVPIIIKASSDEAISKDELEKAFTLAVEWAAGLGNIADMGRTSVLLSYKKIEGIEFDPFLVSGESRWNVYVDAEKTTKRIARFE